MKEVLEFFEKVIRNEPLLQFLLLFPIFTFFSWLFGALVTWGSFLIITLLFYLDKSNEMKKERNRKFLEILSKMKTNGAKRSSATQVPWLKSLINEWWKTLSIRMSETLIENFERVLDKKRPSFVVISFFFFLLNKEILNSIFKIEINQYFKI